MYSAVVDVKANLQKILDSSLDVICTINADIKFVTVSAAAKKVWGYDPCELVGCSLLSIVAEEDYECTLNSIERIKRDSSKNTCENRIYKKDGSIACIAWTVHWDSEDQLMYCVARSTDNKRKVEDLLVESEEQLRFAQKLARMGSWHIDLIKNKIKWSEGLYEVYGVDKEKCQNPTPELFISLIHPDDRAMCFGEVEKMKKAGKSDHIHRLIRPIDGKTIYVRHLSHEIRNEHGEMVAFTGITQDVTEQKETEINLLLSEKRFKSLVQNGSDIIAILDQQGNFKYVSPTSLRITGYEPEELIGRNVFQMMHPDDIPYMTEKFAEVIEDRNDNIPTEHRFIAKNGDWIWLESHGIDLTTESNIAGIVINARNVTERKKLQEELAQAQKKRQRAITSAVIKAQESERSQLGQELHDNVNQVLTTVKLYNEMLFDGIGDPKDILQKSIHHLQSCINEIRSISKRLSAPTLGKITLEESINELVESINLTKRLKITSTINGLEKKMVQQDFHLTVYRIIQEQLNNIIKHAEAGNVSIIIENTPQEFFLQIEDDGKGFDVKARRKGIGITNMETRTENMHGKMEITSSPGKGCKLVARFPPVHER
jgi:PAS domain S-box-containing protein